MEEGASGTEEAGAEEIHLPALANDVGRVRVDVAGRPRATIFVDRGRVWATGATEDADVVASVEEPADLERILAGELNPVVAAIQGRLTLEGNLELATRVILALNAAKPFAGRRPAPGAVEED